jgi:hypothetical protein
MLLGTLVSKVTNLSTAIATIVIVVRCTTLHSNIVGHSLAWCLIAKLLVGTVLVLIAILLLVLGTLLVLVMLGILATVPLIGWPLVSLLKTLLRISMRRVLLPEACP